MGGTKPSRPGAGHDPPTAHMLSHTRAALSQSGQTLGGTVRHEAVCQECGGSFGAHRSDAKWCSDRCRKAAKRADPAAAEPDPDPDSGASSGLVMSVEAELAAAGALDSFAGQLAIALAKRLSHPDESGISSLSKELRTVMSAALAGVTPEPAPEEQDEVTKAREARERKARQAAGRA